MILIIKHIPNEGAGTIETFFRSKGFEIKAVELSRGEKLPKSLSGIDAVVSMGGSMNVDEEKKYPFLRAENAFLKEIISKKIPFFGVCLGSQLLAKAAGARVKKSPKEEIGWFKVSLTNSGKKDKIFKSLDDEFHVFQWHGDTFEIPKDARHLVKAADCCHQALKVGPCAYGFQFHIEVTKEIIIDWVKGHFKGADGRVEKKGQEIIDDYEQHKDRFNKRARKIYQNFLQIIEKNNDSKNF